MHKLHLKEILPFHKGKITGKLSQWNVVDESNESLEYLRIFFNFGYFLHYLPYRFKRLPNGVCILATSKIHKVLCGLIHVLTLFRFITVLREVELSDPTSYFVIGRNCATFVYMFVFIISFWKHQSIFKDIFQELHDKKQLFRNAQYQKPSVFRPKIGTIAYIICCIYTFISILNVVCGHGMLMISEWGFKNLLVKHGKYTQFMFFLGQNNTQDVVVEKLNLPMYFLISLHLTIHFYFKLGAHFADLSILICALTLQHLAKQFSHSFQASFVPVEPSKILERYNALKSLARKINHGIGAVTLCCMLEAMPYYATHIGDILSIPDWFVRFRYIFFIVNFFSIVLVSADVSHKVGSLLEWLNEDQNYNSISKSKLVILTNELTYSRIGLSAMGLFTITYTFIGSLVSVVLTYAVIILQFKTSIQTCSPS